MENEDDAFKRMVAALTAAQREYDAQLTPEERAMEESCACPLCQFVLANRAFVEEFADK